MNIQLNNQESRGNLIASLMISMAFGMTMTIFAIHFIDCYRAGGGMVGWSNGGHLQSMEGWQSIAMDNPHVIRGTFPGTYYVNTDVGTYSTNYSVDDDLVVFLEMQVAE